MYFKRVKKSLLEMLKENDMGITLFETDATFEDFTKIELNENNTDIDPETCN
ncbi:hypothetical protein [Mesonia sp. K4-1]|uniref:hypothetical protein n=1 Tax=Mesonia sp. K4-1 TaxID=2602760 RepID=UPI00164F27A3|nr:hypothetical protein [Mesonia sp. K4-1]